LGESHRWVGSSTPFNIFFPTAKSSLISFVCFRLRVPCSSKGVHFPQFENYNNVTENTGKKSCSFVPLETHSMRREFASTTWVHFL
jgi:hypothetical protein